ncbi:mono/diheme cytochrome c family protein [Sinorhizobium fredii]|uniref:Cytochrome c, class I n=1 Tax=Sinorhizobium fredii (strain USDA 257) TaxID=1185652 RepID=I3X5X1_SINF2|nr:cytochrome c [Sinorhizobium fredii]AFL51277.1 cytochrome c, class I [Sinorhizobium fredii USDA 257]
MIVIRSAILLASVLVAVAVAALSFGWYWLHFGRPVGEAKTAALGRTLYAQHCASCHGALLEGQPDWKRLLPSGRMPAPPHDASGHTWHHPDGVLFRLIKEGPAAVVGGGYQSDMQGFGEILNDDEIRAVLAFLKSTWPERERAYQAEMSRREREEMK